MCPFMFDFGAEKPNVQYIAEQMEGAQVAPSSVITGNNRCPYPIPTVKELLKDIEMASYTVGTEKLLSDVFECGAIAISNSVDKTQFDAREERYLKIINSYKKEEQEKICAIFSKIYALLSSVVYDNGRFDDYLGEIFMRANAGNKHAGQFFTPYHVSMLMAKMSIGEERVQELAKSGEVITINDCCCGGGGMLVAALDVLRRSGVNYAYNCFIDAGDIDIRCVHMTYLQLSLAGVPAIVRHQNALTRELWSVWYTPAYIFQYLRFRKYVNLN